MSVIRGKAAVSFAPNTPLQVVEVNFHPPIVGEVRVKIVATGLCHSDAYVFNGISCAGNNFEDIKGRPVIAGHEAAGVVESIGVGVTSVSPGDHVIILWLPQCDACSVCNSKFMGNSCKKADFVTALLRDDGTSRIRLVSDDTPIVTYLGTATFAEYVILPERNICKIPNSIPFEQACLLGCCVGTGYGCARNIAKVSPGATCAVFGLGAVGLATIIGCKAAGATRIVGVDINSDKFPMALELGATECMNPKETGGELLSLLKGEDGLDFCFECSGASVCLTQAQEALAYWGSLIVAGLQPNGTEVAVKVETLLLGQTIQGGYYGRYKPRPAIHTLCNEIAEGSLDCSKLITHRLPLEKINEALELLQQGRSIRTIINMET